MNENDLEAWKLHDVFTLYEAACLIGGHDPSDINAPYHAGYDATFGALVKAFECRNSMLFSDVVAADFFNLQEITVLKCDLVKWLDAKGLHPSFFFPSENKPNPKNGAYKTALMQLLEDAAHEHWDGVSPDDPHKPTKESIKAWLQDEAKRRGIGHSVSSVGSEGGLSDKITGAMFTIMHPLYGNVKAPNK